LFRTRRRNIGDGTVPLVNLFNNQVPLFAPLESEGTWSLINLLLAIIGVVFALAAVIRALLTKREQDKEDEKAAEKEAYRQRAASREDEGNRKEKRYRRTWLAGSAVLAIANGLLFLFTQDMRLQMVLVDGWTIINAILLAAEIIAMTVTFKKKKEDDKDGDDNSRNRPVTARVSTL
jgi:preprotein translocase subunit SecG